ncbi:MAG: hypothetical protein U9O66_01175 [Patescibacteria group bacterium]|nr:hypothetical protein [Patescibacteria group bacterium]
MKHFITTILLTVFLLNINISLAQTNADIDIKIKVKDTFQINDTLNFTYTLTSNQDTEITYTPYISCEQAPQPFLEEKKISLKANIPYQDKYLSIKVEDNLEPQACTAFIQISNPIEKKIEKEFKIETTPSFQFSLQCCKDQSCAEKTKVFVLDSTIYLDYTSEIDSLEISANLIYPDKKAKQITLPTSIKAEQVGNYELEVIAKKDGYKTVAKKDMFGIIGEQVKIKSASICNADGVCSGQENEQNCPQDCVKVKQTIDKSNLKIIILIIAVVIIIGIIIAVYWFLARKKEFKGQQDKNNY